MLPIVGGNLATTCQWPTAIMLSPVGCSGTLVHPRVVVTARHCLFNESTGVWTPPKSVVLGEHNVFARTVAVSSCTPHPDDDIGFCILAEDVTEIPIVPVMAPCEVSELAVGKAIVEVGFGVTSASGTTYGTKKLINGTIASVPLDQITIDVTAGSQDGEYYGDSGGPLFFQMPDSTWRVVGADCCSPSIIQGSPDPRISTYVSVPHHVLWMQEESGLDLTPCHDASGWNPTAACSGFPTNPGSSVGTWDTLCAGEATVAIQPTCQRTPADAGMPDIDAGRDGSNDISKAGDSDRGDSQGDVSGDSETGWALGDGGATDTGDTPDSGDAGLDAHDSFAASGGTTGAGGRKADASGSSGGSGGTPDGANGGFATEGGNGGFDGSDASTPSDGRGADVIMPSDSGSVDARSAPDSGGSDVREVPAGYDANTQWDSGNSGLDLAATSDGGGTIPDGGTDRPGTKPPGGGCSCRSVSGRSSSGWPSLGLLGVVLVFARRVRRRSSSRGRFVV